MMCYLHFATPSFLLSLPSLPQLTSTGHYLHHISHWTWLPVSARESVGINAFSSMVYSFPERSQQCNGVLFSGYSGDANNLCELREHWTWLDHKHTAPQPLQMSSPASQPWHSSVKTFAVESWRASVRREAQSTHAMKLRNAVSLPHHLSLPPQLPSSCTVCLYPMVVYTSHVKKGHNSRIKRRVHEVWVTLHANEFINKCIIIDVPWLIHHLPTVPRWANSEKFMNCLGKCQHM